MRVVLSIILVCLFLGCKDKADYKKPEGLISKDKMVDLLYEMHLVVGTGNIQNIHLEKNRNYMSLVYEKYGVDSTRFAISNVYYTAHIQEYEEIFEEVERRIISLKDIMEIQKDSISDFSSQAEKAIQRNDSIQRAMKLKK